MKNTIIEGIIKGFNKDKKEAVKIYNNNKFDFLLLEDVEEFKIEDAKLWIEASQNYEEVTNEELKEWKYINGNLIRLY